MSAAPFKAGDKVTCVESKRGLRVLDEGETYTVIRTEESPRGPGFVSVLGFPEGVQFRANRFVLAGAEGVTLDPADPFDAVLIDMVQTNRAKRHDYTTRNSSAWENFDIAEERAARRYGLDREQIRGLAVDMMLFTKDTRLDAIVSRGKAVNESAEDTLLDEAVYAIIRYGRSRYPDGTVPPA